MSRGLVCTIAFALGAPAMAQTTLPMSKITSLWSAWGMDSAAINLDTPTPTGTGCTTPSVYITDPASPQSKLIQSMLLSAYLARRKASVTVNGCLQGSWPIIISVTIEP